MIAVSQCGKNAQRVRTSCSARCFVLTYSSIAVLCIQRTSQQHACLPIFATPSLVMLTVKPAATLSNASKLLKGIA